MDIVKKTAQSDLLPVDLETVKDHLKRIGCDIEDTLITLYSNAAIRACENKLQRSIMDAPHALYAKCWKSYYNLQQYPVTSVTSVQYYDDAGALQTVASGMYRVQSFRAPGVLEFDADFVNPSLDNREYPIIITFRAGDLNPDDVNPLVKDAVLMETADNTKTVRMI